MRRYLKTSINDKRRPIEYVLTGVGVSIVLLIAVLVLSSTTRVSWSISSSLVGLLVLGLIESIGATIITCLSAEKVAKLEIPEMTRNARHLAFKIRRQLKPLWLVKLLNIEHSPYGYPLPHIGVYVEPDCNTGWIAIENSPLFNGLNSERVLNDLSGLLSTRRLRRLGVTSSEISRDGNYYLFYFEDIKTSQRLVVKGNLITFISKNSHEIRLAKNLVWRVSGSTPHLAIIGHTRSGKSFFVGKYLLPLMKLQGWKVYFYSIKDDKYVKQFNGKSDPMKIIEDLEDWERTMRSRNHIITAMGKDTYTEVEDMPDIAIVIDEIANLNGAVSADRKLKQRWETVIGKLTATGASAGIHIIALSQYGTKESFLPTTARANVSDAVILLGMAADSPSDRQYLLPGFELPHREYGTGQGVARIVSAGKRWEKPHFFETPLFKN